MSSSIPHRAAVPRAPVLSGAEAVARVRGAVQALPGAR